MLLPVAPDQGRRLGAAALAQQEVGDYLHRAQRQRGIALQRRLIGGPGGLGAAGQVVDQAGMEVVHLLELRTLGHGGEDGQGGVGVAGAGQRPGAHERHHEGVEAALVDLAQDGGGLGEILLCGRSGGQDQGGHGAFGIQLQGALGQAQGLGLAAVGEEEEVGSAGQGHVGRVGGQGGAVEVRRRRRVGRRLGVAAGQVVAEALRADAQRRPRPQGRRRRLGGGRVLGRHVGVRGGRPRGLAGDGGALPAAGGGKEHQEGRAEGPETGAATAGRTLDGRAHGCHRTFRGTAGRPLTYWDSWGRRHPAAPPS